MKKILLVLLIVSILPACSSRSSAESGCHLLQGIYDSKAEDEQKAQASTHYDKKENGQHLINGLLAAIFSNSSKKDDSCSQN